VFVLHAAYSFLAYYTHIAHNIASE
jgi:hypothetical protein